MENQKKEPPEAVPSKKVLDNFNENIATIAFIMAALGIAYIVMT